MNYADDMPGVVFRRHLGYYTSPGFRRMWIIQGGKTEVVCLLADPIRMSDSWETYGRSTGEPWGIMAEPWGTLAPVL